MSHAGHKIVKCKCGEIVMQCRCFDTNKSVETVQSCDKCKQTTTPRS